MMISIYDHFLDTVNKYSLFKDSKRLLVAVSGGIDSVVLLDLVARFVEDNPEYSFSIAHCNFKLRGENSFRDANFVEQLSRFYKVPLYSTEFDTTDYARKKSISIEMAARELRYDFFEKIITNNYADICLLAHHENDNVETFFLNLLRGTGLKGLRGISLVNGKYVRPLLYLSKDEILDYAHAKSINFVQDETNFDTVFLRNNVRHNILPLLSGVNDLAIKHISETMQTLSNVEKIVDEWFNDTLLKVQDEDGVFSIKKIKETEHKILFLEMLLQPKNFSKKTIAQIAESVQNGIAGKIFYSTTHLLRRERDTLILEENSEEETDFLDIPPALNYRKEFFLSFSDVPKNSRIAVLNSSKIKEPMLIRKWREGDFFYPLGMDKKQKLSDFFNNNKFSSVQKENTWVLCHGEDIVWIVGHRIDDRYKLKFAKKSAGVEAIVVEFS
ncbi:MAG: tRNA lysidine(34) synthetase TilS [Bacteroidales bacterium]|jgi:tRNA(Ile)-lysidine synthase|nr:tRNA lysidine(34) synthetase TilS [Bacteroidales bacterium]